MIRNLILKNEFKWKEKKERALKCFANFMYKKLI